jgi:hypothetical protein
MKIALDRKNSLILLAVIYLVTLGARVFWLSQKEGFHVDFGYMDPVLFSNLRTLTYNNITFSNGNFPAGIWFDGGELKNLALADRKGNETLIKDIVTIRKGGSPVHTNVYSVLFRTLLSKQKEFNIKTVVFRLGTLNLLLFTASFFALFFLLKILFKENKILPYIGTFCSFMATGVLSYTLLFRDYQLQQTMIVVFSYFFIKTLNNDKYILKNNAKRPDFSFIAIMSVITALTMLSGYYPLVFIAMAGLYALYNNYKNKRTKDSSIYFAILSGAVLLTLLVYPAYFNTFIPNPAFGGKSTAGFILSTQGLNKQLGTAVIAKYTFSELGGILLKHCFTPPVLILCAVMIVYLYSKKIKPEFNRQTAVLFGIAVIFTAGIFYITTFKAMRYIAPVFPLFILLPLSLLQPVKTKKIFALFGAFLCLLFTLPAFNKDNIEFLFTEKGEYEFAKHTEIPLYVLGGGYYGDILPYLNDGQAVTFNRSFDEALVKDFEKFYLLVNNESADNFSVNTDVYQIESQTPLAYNSDLYRYHFTLNLVKNGTR